MYRIEVNSVDFGERNLQPFVVEKEQVHVEGVIEFTPQHEIETNAYWIDEDWKVHIDIIEGIDEVKFINNLEITL